jgi:trimethylamine:corrinoid methyltransferase-like protein
VIDDEAIRFIKRMREPVVIDEDTLGFDALRHGMETMGSLLAERHTASHQRKGALVSAGLGQWDSYSQWQETGSPDLIDRAHVRVKDILATHTVPPFDGPTEKAIQKILSAMA